MMSVKGSSVSDLTDMFDMLHRLAADKILLIVGGFMSLTEKTMRQIISCNRFYTRNDFFIEIFLSALSKLAKEDSRINPISSIQYLCSPQIFISQVLPASPAFCRSIFMKNKCRMTHHREPRVIHSNRTERQRLDFKCDIFKQKIELQFGTITYPAGRFSKRVGLDIMVARDISASTIMEHT